MAGAKRSRVPPAVAPWVPSLEEARASGCEANVRRWLRSFDLLTRKPVKVTAWVALRVEARAVVRRTRRERVEISARLAVPGAMPPAPTHFGARVSHFVVTEVEGRLDHACTGCTFEPGRQLCGVCGGQGVIVMDGTRGRRLTRACTCTRGTLLCSTCEGSGRARFVQAIYVDDETDSLAVVRVPAVVPGPIYDLIDAIQSGPGPDELRFSVKQALGSGPYRDSAPGEQSAWGFDMGNTAKNVSGILDRFLGRQTYASEAITWAWPFLHVEHSILGRRYDLLLTKDPSGATRVLLHDF